jgi:hypothetical protein
MEFKINTLNVSNNFEALPHPFGVAINFETPRIPVNWNQTFLIIFENGTTHLNET